MQWVVVNDGDVSESRRQLIIQLKFGQNAGIEMPVFAKKKKKVPWDYNGL